MALRVSVFASLILVFAAVCRATVNLTEQQLRVCQGHDAQLANCSTVGTGGLVWLFSGQADVRFQPSTNPTIGTTLERMNQGSNGSVFTFTLDNFSNETDTYISTARVSNIQLSDNATSITCAEPTPQNPISIVVIVLEVCPSPSSTIIAAVTSTIVNPDRSTTTDPLSLSASTFSSTTSTSPTVSPVLVGGVVVIAVSIVVALLLLLVVIASVMGMILFVYCRSSKGYVVGGTAVEVEQGIVQYTPKRRTPVQLQVDDVNRDTHSTDGVDTKASTDVSNGNVENGHSKEEEQIEEKDSNASEVDVYLDAPGVSAAELQAEEAKGFQVLEQQVFQEDY